jgi:taurine dioxygenase
MMDSPPAKQQELLLPNTQFGVRPFLAERFQHLQAAAFYHIEVRPLSPVLGALVSGVSLAKPISDEVLQELVRARLLYRVLFFHDQEITSDQHTAFARRFGEIEEHPFLKNKEDHADVIEFEKSETEVGVENVWHSDVSWRETPSLGSILCAKEIPPFGGDTMFSDTIAAYECLDDETKQQLDGLRATNDFTQTFGRQMSEAQLLEMKKMYPAVSHPVVRTIPETGEKGIYVNRFFTRHIEGMSSDKSENLLEFLYRQMEFPEFQYRFQWQKNSVAFWDNRMVQHYAVNDYWPMGRVMERVTIIGERPI